MTFLEFVCRRLMGPPVGGRAVWRCPFHEDNRPSFSVRPPKGNFPIKFKCFACGKWGDEFDLLKLYHPKEDYSARRVRRDRLWKEWRALGYDDCSCLRGDRELIMELDPEDLETLQQIRSFLRLFR